MKNEASSDTVKAFFEQWHIYRSVVNNNYMHHQEIVNTIKNIMTDAEIKPLRILELGCGDSHVVHQLTQQGIEVAHYCGIDLSQIGLNLAQKNLDDHIRDVELHCGDMVDITRTLTPGYDFIMAGYTLHHLSTEQTLSVLNACKQLLKPDGMMLVYDIVRRYDESENAYNTRAIQFDRQHWTALTQQQMDMTAEHILQHDQPKSFVQWHDMIEQSGFHNDELLYQSPNGFYALFTVH